MKNSSAREDVRSAWYTIELGNVYVCDGLQLLVWHHTQIHTDQPSENQEQQLMKSKNQWCHLCAEEQATSMSV